jgi:hypothetical protein
LCGFSWIQVEFGTTVERWCTAADGAHTVIGETQGVDESERRGASDDLRCGVQM